VDKHINVLLQAMNELSLLISRIFLVKTTFINEYKLFQKVKYLISEVLQDWFQERSVLADKQNDYIQRLLNDLRDLPLST
jgi:sorting nexin-8